MLQAADAGIVQGRSGNRFAPQATAKRAEAVTMIMNMLKAEK
ncbi:S-layer homology domain-containing protein [Paenibacillus sp. PL2-23]